MGKIYTALGLMTGTSMDGVDVSIIKSDGISHFTNVLDEFYQLSDDLQSRLFSLRDKILSKADLIKFLDEIKLLEREITIFHGDNKFLLTTKDLLQVVSLSPLSRLISSLFQVPDRDQMMVRSLTVLMAHFLHFHFVFLYFL